MGGILEEIMAESPQTILELYQTKYTDTSYKKVVNPVGNLTFRDFLSTYGIPKIFTNMQYIRHGGFVDVDMIFEDTEYYNYVAYNNGEGAGYEYAFIINREFLNFNCTRLYLQYDVWANNINKFKTLTQKVYTIRRHVDNTQVKETVGYSEDIPLTFHYTGEYRAQSAQLVVCLCYSRASSESSFKPVNAPCMPYDPMNYIFFSYDNNLVKNEPEESDFSDILKVLDSVYIVGAYMFKSSLNIGAGELITTRFKAGDEGALKGFKLSSTLNGLSTNITFNLDSVSKESMLYNSQFTKYYITDGVSKKQLRREIVGNGNSPTLTLDETYFIDNSGVYRRLEIPQGILTSPNSSNNFISSIGFKLPTYIDNVERADQKATIAMLTKVAGALIGGGFAGASAGVIVGNAVGTAIDSAGQAAIKHMEAEENWYTFNDYGDFTATLAKTNQMGLSYILEYQGTDEQKQLLFDKWNAEGYIVNKILPLTIRSRKYYDYIKTKDLCLNITAPSEEVTQLNEIFNRGVTIWHYTGEGIKYPNYVTNAENEVI